MTSRRRKWLFVSGFTAAICLSAAAVGSSQFISYNDRTTAILEGNWQSCREDDGKYSERIYDGKLPGLGPFELHMGPYHEFALFRGVQDEHRDHSDPENLLKPYIVEMTGTTARHKWAAANLQLEVALAGGSKETCESWFLSLKRITPTSSH